MTLDPLLPTFTDFKPESLRDVNLRYNGFGHNLIVELQTKLPTAYSSLQFYRDFHFQREDVFAICSWSGKNFGLQLDPELEVIVLWNQSEQIEIGSWEVDPEKIALNYIKDHFM